MNHVKVITIFAIYLFSLFTTNANIVDCKGTFYSNHTTKYDSGEEDFYLKLWVNVDENFTYGQSQLYGQTANIKDSIGTLLAVESSYGTPDKVRSYAQYKLGYEPSLDGDLRKWLEKNVPSSGTGFLERWNKNIDYNKLSRTLHKVLYKVIYPEAITSPAFITHVVLLDVDNNVLHEGGSTMISPPENYYYCIQ